jgi:hypothetical protein
VWMVPDVRGSGFAKCAGRVACAFGRALGNVGLSAAQGMAQNDAAKVIKGGVQQVTTAEHIIHATGHDSPRVQAGIAKTIARENNSQILRQWRAKGSFADLSVSPA